MAPRKPILGLAGGIGSGKSWVAARMQEAGAVVIDADRLAHEAVDQPEIRRRLREDWGPQAVDDSGRVDRAFLARRVFADPAQRKRLEEIVHPWVKEKLAERVREARENPRCRAVVLDVPLLFEVGLDRECDRIVFVEADRATRLGRVRDRGWDEGELDRREKNQGALDRKKALAQYIIANSDDEVSSSEQVRTLFNRILSELSDRPAS